MTWRDEEAEASALVREIRRRRRVRVRDWLIFLLGVGLIVAVAVL